MRKALAIVILCAASSPARADWDAYSTAGIGLQARGGTFSDHFDSLLMERALIGLRIQNVGLEAVATLLEADGRGERGDRLFFTFLVGLALRGDLPVSVDTSLYLRAGYALADFNDGHRPPDESASGTAHQYSAGIESVIYRATQHTPTGRHPWYLALFAEVEHASIDIGNYEGVPVGGAASWVMVGIKTGSGDR